MKVDWTGRNFGGQAVERTKPRREDVKKNYSEMWSNFGLEKISPGNLYKLGVSQLRGAPHVVTWFLSPGF
jgi:hypothetical protein